MYFGKIIKYTVENLVEMHCIDSFTHVDFIDYEKYPRNYKVVYSLFIYCVFFIYLSHTTIK